jgi:hypothetical protein
MSTEEIGKAAYEGYCKSHHFAGPHGESFPHWDQLDPQERAAWLAAGKAVSDAISLATGRG